MADESVGDLAGLYLGNILYALELAAMTLEHDGKPDAALFYRGIARKLGNFSGRNRVGFGATIRCQQALAGRNRAFPGSSTAGRRLVVIADEARIVRTITDDDAVLAQ